jgi:hypothetical protein
LGELGDKLGPLLWQFGPTKKFDPEDFERFLKLLPARAGGIRLRHALEARHPSFANPEFISSRACSWRGGRFRRFRRVINRSPTSRAISFTRGS